MQRTTIAQEHAPDIIAQSISIWWRIFINLFGVGHIFFAFIPQICQYYRFINFEFGIDVRCIALGAFFNTNCIIFF